MIETLAIHLLLYLSIFVNTRFSKKISCWFVSLFTVRYMILTIKTLECNVLKVV